MPVLLELIQKSTMNSCTLLVKASMLHCLLTGNPGSIYLFICLILVKTEYGEQGQAGSKIHKTLTTTCGNSTIELLHVVINKKQSYVFCSS